MGMSSYIAEKTGRTETQILTDPVYIEARSYVKKNAAALILEGISAAALVLNKRATNQDLRKQCLRLTQKGTDLVKKLGD